MTPTAPAPGARAGHEDARLLAGTLLAVVGLIHVKALVDHVDHYVLFGVLFGLVAWWQIGLGVVLSRHPEQVPDRVLVAAIVATLGVVVVWVVSRTVGLPIGPWAGEAEAIGVSDAIVTITELVIVGLLVALVRPESPGGARLRWLEGGHAVRLGVALGTAGLIAALLGGHAH